MFKNVPVHITYYSKILSANNVDDGARYVTTKINANSVFQVIYSRANACLNVHQGIMKIRRILYAQIVWLDVRYARISSLVKSVLKLTLLCCFQVIAFRLTVHRVITCLYNKTNALRTVLTCWIKWSKNAMNTSVLLTW